MFHDGVLLSSNLENKIVSKDIFLFNILYPAKVPQNNHPGLKCELQILFSADLSAIDVLIDIGPTYF
jgi:hypothetical protein